MPTLTQVAEPVSRPPATPTVELPAAPAGRRSPWRIALPLLLVGGVAAAVVARVAPLLFQAPVANVVRASGRIEARETTIAPKDIQGRVVRLLVDEGTSVRKGQTLAELEAKQLDARRAALVAGMANLDAQIRQASLDVVLTANSAAATVAAAQAAVSTARAHVARARAVQTQASAEYTRELTLFNEAVVPKSTLDQADMAWQTSDADVEATEREVEQAQSNLALAQTAEQAVDLKRHQVDALKANRRAIQAQIAEADANMAERTVIAPIDGTILSRPVEVGDVVSPGAPLFVMVDLNRLYVKVYIPEPDIPKLKLGDPADVSVDAFPGRTFPARITKIYNQAEFTPKNVETQEERLKLVFGVELSFTQSEGLLKPGMPADGAIHWTPSDNQTRHER
jgi:multidrug resistance efflux pump